MSKKSRNIYMHCLQYINTNLFQFHPSSFTTDYKNSMRNAIKQVFPMVTLKSCWFHYCQALKRNAGKIKNFSKNNTD